MTTPPVKIIECPRDAWQAMPQQIPPEVKADYLRALVAAGFTHIDAVSFVSPSAVPQMADSERVLALLDPARRWRSSRSWSTSRARSGRFAPERSVPWAFPIPSPPHFLSVTKDRRLQQARQTLKKICTQASRAGLGVVAYLSMAFGNPYGDPWRQEDVIAACLTLKGLGVEQISLADTVGMASPGQIHSLVSAVLAEVPGIELGAHLHARPEQAALKVAAAYQAGCRRLDMALGGQGGCPFAQDALVGNVATEAALAELSKLGAKLPPLRPLDELLARLVPSLIDSVQSSR